MSKETIDERKMAAAPEENWQPLAEVIKEYLPAAGKVLEIASGTGQHAAYFTAQFSNLIWQPTDQDEELIISIEAWRKHTNLENFLPAQKLDVRWKDWRLGDFDAIFNANMVHISPWECTLGLMEGVGRYLTSGGRFLQYGPFFRKNIPGADSNLSFDEMLRSRNPDWGVRFVEDIEDIASKHGLALLKQVEMPRDNHTLIFEKS